MKDMFKEIKFDRLYIESETSCKFNKGTSKTRYIKILNQCLDNYIPTKEIYPNTKCPILKQLRDMCRVGLLKCYNKEGERTYFWKTTDKGLTLLVQIEMKESLRR